jgi:hypothetical protein
MYALYVRVCVCVCGGMHRCMERDVCVVVHHTFTCTSVNVNCHQINNVCMIYLVIIDMHLYGYTYNNFFVLDLHIFVALFLLLD